MKRPDGATHANRAGTFYKADPRGELNWLQWSNNVWVEVGTVPAGTLKVLCDVLDYVPPPHMPSAPTPCVPAPIQPASLLNDVFTNFGCNWKWASMDYRGVARVHTFQPKFTATGRIEVPNLGMGNSMPCEAFNLIALPTDFKPFWINRLGGMGYPATDRFGIVLPAGADPIAAADVVQVPTPQVVDVSMFAKGLDNPKYQIARTERCRCDITSEQLATLISRELNIDVDGLGPFTLYATNEGVGVALTVEWERHL